MTDQLVNIKRIIFEYENGVKIAAPFDGSSPEGKAIVKMFFSDPRKHKWDISSEKQNKLIEQSNPGNLISKVKNAVQDFLKI